MQTTDINNAAVVDKTIAAHQEVIATLNLAVKDLLSRLEPVASPTYPEEPLEVLEPKSGLCDVAQEIVKETFYLECMLSQVRSMARRLQLPLASHPEDPKK